MKRNLCIRLIALLLAAGLVADPTFAAASAGEPTVAAVSGSVFRVAGWGAQTRNSQPVPNRGLSLPLASKEWDATRNGFLEQALSARALWGRISGAMGPRSWCTQFMLSLMGVPAAADRFGQAVGDPKMRQAIRRLTQVWGPRQAAALSPRERLAKIQVVVRHAARTVLYPKRERRVMGRATPPLAERSTYQQEAAPAMIPGTRSAKRFNELVLEIDQARRDRDVAREKALLAELLRVATEGVADEEMPLFEPMVQAIWAALKTLDPAILKLEPAAFLEAFKKKLGNGPEEYRLEFLTQHTGQDGRDVVGGDLLSRFLTGTRLGEKKSLWVKREDAQDYALSNAHRWIVNTMILAARTAVLGYEAKGLKWRRRDKAVKGQIRLAGRDAHRDWNVRVLEDGGWLGMGIRKYPANEEERAFKVLQTITSEDDLRKRGGVNLDQARVILRVLGAGVSDSEVFWRKLGDHPGLGMGARALVSKMIGRLIAPSKTDGPEAPGQERAASSRVARLLVPPDVLVGLRALVADAAGYGITQRGLAKIGGKSSQKLVNALGSSSRFTKQELAELRSAWRKYKKEKKPPKRPLGDVIREKQSQKSSAMAARHKAARAAGLSEIPIEGFLATFWSGHAGPALGRDLKLDLFPWARQRAEASPDLAVVAYVCFRPDGSLRDDWEALIGGARILDDARVPTQGRLLLRRVGPPPSRRGNDERLPTAREPDVRRVRRKTSAIQTPHKALYPGRSLTLAQLGYEDEQNGVPVEVFNRMFDLANAGRMIQGLTSENLEALEVFINQKRGLAVFPMRRGGAQTWTGRGHPGPFVLRKVRPDRSTAAAYEIRPQAELLTVVDALVDWAKGVFFIGEEQARNTRVPGAQDAFQRAVQLTRAEHSDPGVKRLQLEFRHEGHDRLAELDTHGTGAETLVVDGQVDSPVLLLGAMLSESLHRARPKASEREVETLSHEFLFEAVLPQAVRSAYEPLAPVSSIAGEIAELAAALARENWRPSTGMDSLRRGLRLALRDIDRLPNQMMLDYNPSAGMVRVQRKLSPLASPGRPGPNNPDDDKPPRPAPPPVRPAPPKPAPRPPPIPEIKPYLPRAPAARPSADERRLSLRRRADGLDAETKGEAMRFLREAPGINLFGIGLNHRQVRSVLAARQTYNGFREAKSTGEIVEWVKPMLARRKLVQQLSAGLFRNLPMISRELEDALLRKLLSMETLQARELLADARFRYLQNLHPLTEGALLNEFAKRWEPAMANIRSGRVAPPEHIHELVYRDLLAGHDLVFLIRRLLQTPEFTALAEKDVAGEGPKPNDRHTLHAATQEFGNPYEAIRFARVTDFQQFEAIRENLVERDRLYYDLDWKNVELLLDFFKNDRDARPTWDPNDRESQAAYNEAKNRGQNVRFALGRTQAGEPPVIRIQSKALLTWSYSTSSTYRTIPEWQHARLQRAYARALMAITGALSSAEAINRHPELGLTRVEIRKRHDWMGEADIVGNTIILHDRLLDDENALFGVLIEELKHLITGEEDTPEFIAGNLENWYGFPTPTGIVGMNAVMQGLDFLGVMPLVAPIFAKSAERLGLYHQRAFREDPFAVSMRDSSARNALFLRIADKLLAQKTDKDAKRVLARIFPAFDYLANLFNGMFVAGPFGAEFESDSAVKAQRRFLATAYGPDLQGLFKRIYSVQEGESPAPRAAPLRGSA